MTLAEKLNRLILNLGDKKTDNTLQGTPLTGEDTRLLKDVLAGMYDLIINSGGGGSGIQSVTGTNVDNTDPDNPIVNLTSSNIFDSTYGDVSTAITNIDFDQQVLLTNIGELNTTKVSINGSTPITGKQTFQAGVNVTLQSFTDNTAALGGGLVTGDLYQTAGIVKIVI